MKIVTYMVVFKHVRMFYICILQNNFIIRENIVNSLLCLAEYRISIFRCIKEDIWISCYLVEDSIDKLYSTYTNNR